MDGGVGVVGRGGGDGGVGMGNGGSDGCIVVVDGPVGVADTAVVSSMSSSGSRGVGWVLEGAGGPRKGHDPAEVVDITEDNIPETIPTVSSSSSNSYVGVVPMSDGSRKQKGRSRADAFDLTGDSCEDAKKPRQM